MPKNNKTGNGLIQTGPNQTFWRDVVSNFFPISFLFRKFNQASIDMSNASKNWTLQAPQLCNYPSSTCLVTLEISHFFLLLCVLFLYTHVFLCRMKRFYHIFQSFIVIISNVRLCWQCCLDYAGSAVQSMSVVLFSLCWWCCLVYCLGSKL